VYKQSQLKRTFDLSTFNVSTNSSSVQDEFSSDNACNSASSNFCLSNHHFWIIETNYLLLTCFN